MPSLKMPWHPSDYLIGGLRRGSRIISMLCQSQHRQAPSSTEWSKASKPRASTQTRAITSSTRPAPSLSAQRRYPISAPSTTPSKASNTKSLKSTSWLASSPSPTTNPIAFSTSLRAILTSPRTRTRSSICGRALSRCPAHSA
jgi:hypothetical protein